MQQERKFIVTESVFSNLQGRYVYLQSNEVLYRQTESPESVYLVLKGTIDLIRRTKNGVVHVKTVKQDGFLGIDDVLQNHPRNETAVATEDSQLLRIKLVEPYKDLFESRRKITSLENIAEENDIATEPVLSEGLYKIQEIRGQKVISFLGSNGNLSNAVFFKNQVFTFIDEGNKDIIIDLTACTTIDSTFLGTLIATLKKVSSLGGSLKLACRESIWSWLAVMTKLDKVFEIYSTLDEALDSCEVVN